MAKKNFCMKCYLKSKKNITKYWCKICETPLCVECYDEHRKNKFFEDY